MGSQLNEIQCKIVFWTKEQNLGYAAGTTVALGLSDSLWFLPGSWFSLGSPAPGPCCLSLFVGFAPNLLIPEFTENSAQQMLVQVSRPCQP